MIRHALAMLLVLAGCKKQNTDGMPPANDWGSAQPSAASKPADLPPPPPIQTGNKQQDEPDQEQSDQQAPPDHQVVAEQTAPKQLEKQADGKYVLGPFVMTVPADWTQKPVTSNMRAADFALPGKAGAEAELVIYYFGPNGAGTVQDNLDRWVGQFSQPEGKPKIEKAKFGGQDATIVSVSGHFNAPAMMGGGEAVDKADQSLLGAIVGSPNGPYYFKLVGAKPTVAANDAKFRDMLKSLTVKP